MVDVNIESLKTLREMMKEIDEKPVTEKRAKERKAIFRAIEVISAYEHGDIVSIDDDVKVVPESKKGFENIVKDKENMGENYG